MRDEAASRAGKRRRSRVGRAWKRSLRRLRRREAPARLSLFPALPDFLIVGVGRGGTSSLYRYLGGHPLVGLPRRKEIHFFCHNYDRGLSWYRRHFPSALPRAYARARFGGRLQTGEATPCYLYYPEVPARVAAALPSVKIIALVRDPVPRVYSHYHHRLRRGKEPLGFEEALERDLEQLRSQAGGLFSAAAGDPGRGRSSYLAAGLYAEQLERWYAELPRDRVLVLCSEDLFERTPEVYAQVLEFLELPPHLPKTFEAPRRKQARAEMSAEARRRLVDFYREPNERLYALLGRDLGWPR